MSEIAQNCIRWIRRKQEIAKVSNETKECKIARERFESYGIKLGCSRLCVWSVWKEEDTLKKAGSILFRQWERFKEIAKKKLKDDFKRNLYWNTVQDSLIGGLGDCRRSLGYFY